MKVSIDEGVRKLNKGRFFFVYGHETDAIPLSDGYL